jgi:hypothetical protein
MVWPMTVDETYCERKIGMNFANYYVDMRVMFNKLFEYSVIY